MYFVIGLFLTGALASAAYLTHHRRRQRSGAHRATSEARGAAGRVVETYPVLSDRLMDAQTGRIDPSTRHRVPPWVTDPRMTYQAGPGSDESQRPGRV